MPTVDNTIDCTRADRPAIVCEEYPEFGLDWLIDDPIAPERVTITPADPESPTTEWLSVDAAAAVSLEAVQ